MPLSAATLPAMTGVNAGAAVVEVLKAEGVTNIFGMPGGHVIDIYDALERTPEIRHSLVRHEQIAGCLAAGYAQLTGDVGVCLVTAGPGVTNLLTAISEAYLSSLPVIIIAGRGSTATSHRGASQELPTDRIFAPVTKMSVRIDRADLIIDHLRRAFVLARSGKPGPVLLDIPKDLLTQTIDVAPYRVVGPKPRTLAALDDVATAAELLAGAERPLLIAGGGSNASGASERLTELAELLAAPVLTSFSGRGSISDDHPLSAGGLGAHRNRVSRKLLIEADVVLGVGTRFEEMETNYKPDFLPAPDAQYIQLDIDPDEMGRGTVPSLPLVGDARSVLEQLKTELIERHGLSPDRDFRTVPRIAEIRSELDELEEEARELAREGRKPISPLRVIAEAREVFPKDTNVAIDIGKLAQHMAGAYPYFKIYNERSTIVSSSFYSMGFAAGAAPALRAAHPDEPALCFVGDGSFQMIMSVLPTAAEDKLGVTWCILNDYAIGSIRDIQEYSRGNRIYATEFDVQPDFAALAKASGCYGEFVSEPEEVGPALRRAFDANEKGVPAVLDFSVFRLRLSSTRDHYGFYPAGAGELPPEGEEK